MKRPILNYLGETIGELDVPDDTPEDAIAAKLALYAMPPNTPTLPTIVKEKIEQYERMAPQLLREVKAMNTLNGITTSESAQVFEEYGTIIMAVREGAFPTALHLLTQKQPSGFMTQERIDALIALIRSYL